MSDGIFSSFRISAMGLRAQRIRLDVAAENLANAETTRTAAGGPYRPKTVSFVAQGVDRPRPGGGAGASFRQLLAAKQGERESVLSPTPASASGIGLDVVVGELRDPFVSEYDPNHPDADEKGVVMRPNVDGVTEMMTLMKATRAYEANATALDAAKEMMNRALDI
jgi:flagellar basal-body rod protein FlgC